jgi:hypothetical protein
MLEAGVTEAVVTHIAVSYRYVLVGTEYQLVRVECQQVDSGGFQQMAGRAVKGQNGIIIGVVAKF